MALSLPRSFAALGEAVVDAAASDVFVRAASPSGPPERVLTAKMKPDTQVMLTARQSTAMVMASLCARGVSGEG